MLVRTLIIAFAVSWTLVSSPSDAEIVHQEKSLYRNIIVEDTGKRRCLKFSLRKAEQTQSCMDLRNPEHVAIAFARMVFAGLLVNTNPNSILVVGLGGGSIPAALNQIFPQSQITIVEIDEAVVRVAKKYFSFRENSNMKVVVSDGRVYIKRAGLRSETYDLIVLDAFNGDYIPEHMMTREFLEETKRLLSFDGVLVANTFSNSKLYDHESVTYQNVFKIFFNFRTGYSINRIIIASNSPLPSRKILKRRSKMFKKRLIRHNIKITEYPPQMKTDVDWDTRKRPLTDQYSPANLLRSTNR